MARLAPAKVFLLKRRSDGEEVETMLTARLRGSRALLPLLRRRHYNCGVVEEMIMFASRHLVTFPPKPKKEGAQRRIGRRQLGALF